MYPGDLADRLRERAERLSA